MIAEYNDHFELLSTDAQKLISQIRLFNGFDIHVINEIQRSTTLQCGTVSFLTPYDHAIEYSIWKAKASIEVYQAIDYADIYQKCPVSYGYKIETYAISNADLNIALSRLLNIIRMRSEFSTQMHRDYGPGSLFKRWEAKSNANTEHTTGSESCYSN